jgi:multidrug efflux pump subunit AcrB
VRLRELSGPDCFPQCGYQIDLAVSGPDAEQVRKLADKLAERLRQGNRLAEVWANTEATRRPQLYLELDRARCQAVGVKPSDVFTTLQVFFGSCHIGDFDKRGRTCQVVLQFAGPIRDSDQLKNLPVRITGGRAVPLCTLAEIRHVEAPVVIDRLDLWPMVEVTANLTAAVSLSQARRLCETAAEELCKELRLSTDYRLTWLAEMPAPE